ncbi:MAG: isocitrate/isopropylmalate dehydrogenase family protein [Thaumarchaeota archaeon]|nr:isocitrate/isopropylmalate dehydrogenase family protein [Nitrososphaerota archaeon]
MTNYTIALLEGDGIGPEISSASVEVLKALKNRFGISFDIRKVPAGDRCKAEGGEALPDSSISAIKDSDAGFKAPVGDTAADVIVRLRQMLNLYANIRPSKTLPTVPSLKPEIDFVIVRENTECLYRGMEFEFDGGVVALRTITRKASARIAAYAFDLAEQRESKKVVAVHKSNVLRKSDGLFSQVCREVASQHPGVSFSEMLVDAAAMNLIRMPESFDVIVTTNMYGDILSDEAAQLVGGLGLAPSANIGESFAIFEPVHGAAPDIAGRGQANPIAMILTSCMMLEWLSKTRRDDSCARAAEAVRKAVDRTLESGVRTPDLGGASTTSQVGAAVAKLVAS